jgi:porin
MRIKFAEKLCCSVLVAISVDFAWAQASAAVDHSETMIPMKTEDWWAQNMSPTKLLDLLVPTRSDWRERGLDIGGLFLMDYGSAHRDSKTETKTVSTININADVRLDKLFGLEGQRFFLNAVFANGRRLQGFMGDAQIASNIEAPDCYVRPHEAWYEWTHGRMSWLFGFFDLNSEFYVTPGSVFFVNSSFGIGSELALFGPHGPSTFPVTSPTLRFRWALNDSSYFLLAASDPIPGTPNGFDPHFVKVDLKREGLLLISEVGFAQENFNSTGLRKAFFGSWTPTRDMPLSTDAAEPTENPLGLYTGLEWGLTDHIGFFNRYGLLTQGGKELYSSNWVAGIIARGFFGDFDFDEWGLGFTHLDLSDQHQSNLRVAGENPQSHETFIELTVAIRVFKGLYLQPSLQWVQNPSGIEGQSRVQYLRFEARL